MRKLLLCATAFAALAYAAPASALTVWDMSGGQTNPPGFTVQGTSKIFSAISGDVGLQITAFGLTGVGLGTAEALVTKNTGGDEIGLGLNNDPSGDHEITVGSAILVNWSNGISAGATSFSWQMDSTTPSGLPNGEKWLVLGSNSNTISTFTHVIGSGTNDESLHTVGAGFLYNYYLFEATAGNVLLNEIDGSGGSLTPVAAVPEPGTWAMLLLGFIGLAAAFRSRRRVAGFA